jgi:hypothetical protein
MTEGERTTICVGLAIGACAFLLPWSEEFMRTYQAAMAEAPQPIGAKRYKPGSIAAAVTAYLASRLYFGSKAAGTQAMRQPVRHRGTNSFNLSYSFCQFGNASENSLM